MGADIKQIRNRIKSVDSTLHITKAMKLVASSKIHRCEEKYRAVSVYAETLYGMMGRLLSKECASSPCVKPKNPDSPTLFVVIEADRGLAGSYNGNVNRLLEAEIGSSEAAVIPIGKRAADFASRRGYTVPRRFESSEHIAQDELTSLAEEITDGYMNGKYGAVKLIYTEYRNVISQVASVKTLFPLEISEKTADSLIEYEPGREAVLEYALPMYLNAVLTSSVAESVLAEQYARRNAMDSASKNANDMIEKLNVSYNRARQNTITQEITEIVAGANAGKL